MLGKAKFDDFKAFSVWYIDNAIVWGKEQRDAFYEFRPHNKDIVDLYKNQFDVHLWPDDTEEKKLKKYKDKAGRNLSEIEPVLNYMDTYNTTWDIEYVFENSKWAIIAFGMVRFIVPDANKWLDMTFLKDYENTSVQELRGLSGDSNSIVPHSADAGLTTKTVTSMVDDKKSSIEELKQEMIDVKNAQTGIFAEKQKEIEKMIAELEELKAQQLEILHQKELEMQNELKKLEMQLFVLESEIYSIRCFLGEVVEFSQIAKGIPAKEETPVVLFQKVRYLDEELGKMASIFDIEWHDHKLFEQLIASNPFALETFCPNNKCVTIVRLSKSGRYLGLHETYANMLNSYKLLHGTKIGIIVRNGENIYVGWTDEKRINVREDMFYTPETKVLDEGQEGGQSTKEEVASRIFIFSILQGLLENKKIISLPEKQSFMQPSKYIIYSAAENWLSDNRFPPFNELIDRCNEKVRQGDTILTVQSLRPQHSSSIWGSGYKNDRGRGYADRTHDVSASDCTLYNINLIEKDVQKFAKFVHDNDSNRFYHTRIYDDDIPKPNAPMYHFDSVREDVTYHYFISLLKRWSMSGTARANFEVYSDEFINLTFMNSVWLHNAVITKNIGGWRVGGQMADYAYAIKYLKTALDYVKKREEEEREFILEHYPELDSVTDWQVKLTDWKLEYDVHTITSYQAKRFAKWLKEEFKHEV